MISFEFRMKNEKGIFRFLLGNVFVSINIYLMIYYIHIILENEILRMHAFHCWFITVNFEQNILLCNTLVTLCFVKQKQ